LYRIVELNRTKINIEINTMARIGKPRNRGITSGNENGDKICGTFVDIEKLVSIPITINASAI